MTKEEEVLIEEGVRIREMCGVGAFESLEVRQDDVGAYARELFRLWLNLQG